MPDSTDSASESSRRSLAQINRMLRSIVESETLEHYFWVGGRIERFYRSDRGHLYFDLVHDKTRIRCMTREERAGDILFDLSNGLDVEVHGEVRFFEARAEAQIDVRDIRLVDAQADATPALERLRAEGLYPTNKRPPPSVIRQVGVITSRSSRAIGDFETAYQSAGERSVLAPLIWRYVMLEGERAAASIVDGIQALNSDDRVDVIVIIRGGGRSEKLAVFDQYPILRAIAASGKYILTGIGHHRDHTLADDVSDFVASTPTAAAHHLAELCRDSPPAERRPRQTQASKRQALQCRAWRAYSYWRYWRLRSCR